MNKVSAACKAKVDIKFKYAFIDESGNFDFDKTGTRHLVLSVFITDEPASVSARMGALKYSFLSKGINIPQFHASTDRQATRDAVFSEVHLLKRCWGHTFWLDKLGSASRAPASSTAVYEIFGEALVSFVEERTQGDSAYQWVFVFDRALSTRDENAVLSRLNVIFKRLRQPFHIYFHHVSKDFNGQVADYVAWAQYVALERQEFRPLWALPANLSGSSNLLDVPRGLAPSHPQPIN